MKCKYCDYENPEEAIMCECCGATLATQIPNSTIRNREKTPKKKTAGKEILALCLALVLLFSSVVSLMLVKKSQEPKPPVTAPIPLYDPKSGKYIFLSGGRLTDYSISLEERYNGGLGDFLYRTESNLPSRLKYFLYLTEDNIVRFSPPDTGDKKIIGDYFCAVNNKKNVLLVLRTKESSDLYIYPAEGGDGNHLFENITYYTLSDNDNEIYLLKKNGEGCEFIHYSFEEERILFTANFDKMMTSVASLHRGGFLRIENQEKVDEATYRNTVYLYNTKEKSVAFMSDNMKLMNFSPDGKSYTYTEEKDKKLYSYYVDEKGEKSLICEDMYIRSVSDDGKYIYASDKNTNDVYFIDSKREAKLIAYNSTIVSTSTNREQVLIKAEDDLYISSKGSYPTLLLSDCNYSSSLYLDEGSFANGILTINKDQKTMLCKITGGYKVKILAEDIGNFHRINDKKTVYFRKDGDIYKYPLSGSLKPVRVYKSEFSKGILDIYEAENGVYVNEKNKLVYISDNGFVKTVSDSGILRGTVFKDRFVFDLFEEDVDSPSKTRNLYYSKNGGKKKLAIENIQSFICMSDAIYIYKLNENSGETGIPLYDVYGGTSIENIKLLASGVYKAGYGDVIPE